MCNCSIVHRVHVLLGNDVHAQMTEWCPLFRVCSFLNVRNVSLSIFHIKYMYWYTPSLFIDLTELTKGLGFGHGVYPGNLQLVQVVSLVKG